MLKDARTSVQRLADWSVSTTDSAATICGDSLTTTGGVWMTANNVLPSAITRKSRG